VSYEDLKQSAAIVCFHVSYPERPILRATRDRPLELEDSGWQFLCGVEHHGDASRGKVLALEEVPALDATLRIILDAEPKVSFERSTVSTAWRQVPYANENKEL